MARLATRAERIAALEMLAFAEQGGGPAEVSAERLATVARDVRRDEDGTEFDWREQRNGIS